MQTNLVTILSYLLADLPKRCR